jgi:hypothetical protein
MLEILFTLLFQNFAAAEYRAFELIIEKSPLATTPNNPPLDQRRVISNLDPEQYATYYPLQPGETIRYENTWMCKGRTGGMQPPCPNPKAVQNVSPENN